MHVPTVPVDHAIALLREQRVLWSDERKVAYNPNPQPCKNMLTW